jgi:UPF0176 protein
MDSNQMNYKILLYYKFAKISDPLELVKVHQEFCLKNGLKGRVYLAHEGLNGTVSGTIEACDAYKKFIESFPFFKGIEWKEELVNQHQFAKMKTKFKKSICNMGSLDQVDVEKYHGKYLSPKEWRKILESNEDYILLDIRNNYEGKIGKFKNAIVPDIENFHEFPKLIDELEPYKDKKILMYCTGGIRCEKFSAAMVERGFKDVNQLHGGIIRYMQEEKGAHFEGACFVFDDRMQVLIGEKPISNCKFCNKPEFRYVNCANMYCNELFIVCDDCAKTHEACCSTACQDSPGKRPFNPETFRIPFRKKGLIFQDLKIKEIKSKREKTA